MDKVIVYVDHADYAQQLLAPLFARESSAQTHWVLVACAPQMTHRVSKWVSHSARENWRAKWADKLFAQILPALRVPAGREIAKALPEGGEMVIFVGRLDAQNARERKQGIEEALQGTGITMLDTRLDQGDQARAQENAEAMIVAHPGVDALVGLWSYNGPAILQAVRSANKIGAIKIVCFDEDTATLDGIAEGAIAATIVQRPFEFGYRSIQLLADLAERGDEAIPPGGIIDTGVVVVDGANVASFRAELEKLLQ